MSYNRNSYEYKRWRQKVLWRDGGRCTKCGTDKHLEVHHIKPVSEYPELALDVNNGITLCTRCHYEVDGRTYDEYKEYKREYNHQLSFTLKGFKKTAYWLRYRLEIIRDLIIIFPGMRKLIRKFEKVFFTILIIVALIAWNWLKTLFNFIF